jgi:hypothetical protein
MRERRLGRPVYHASRITYHASRITFPVSRFSFHAKLPPVPKWFKTILAVLLLPVCIGAGSALWRVVRETGDADTIWVAFSAGAGCWVAIYLLLPKPMRIYVFGHELTHAVWTWLLGGKVKKFKASASGGHVIVSKSNFVIALAPYFFPLYAVLVVLVFLAGNWLWNWAPYLVWFHLLLGAAYAFHVTLTWHILKHSQSDISNEGYLFSAVIIFLGNVSVLLVGIPLLVSKVGVMTALSWWYECTRQTVQYLGPLWRGR